MCSSVAFTISSFLDEDSKSWHCTSRILGNLFWVAKFAYRIAIASGTNRAVDWEKVSSTMFVIDVFAITSPSAVFSRCGKPN